MTGKRKFEWPNADNESLSDSQSSKIKLLDLFVQLIKNVLDPLNSFGASQSGFAANHRIFIPSKNTRTLSKTAAMLFLAPNGR